MKCNVTKPWLKNHFKPIPPKKAKKEERYYAQSLGIMVRMVPSLAL
jgi:hypothetical protein